ncbi:alpha-ketoglutarate-dependent dioxygenase alkB homolog 4 isoform X3 [Latimeria chalumnae]|uniref:alpha-ketoglutarate-dependent dioxygenase alkB homolog 4 isoform X3 n=1 Tax=Latimeria chalumnae TaxID=7897 RepID=UPI0006D93000|nr:PREDICTED: alpha-ketoglutarate-dependent dioxygenase alkB homolog 4 isoform X3 [Latimeria chalumnae]|eukprot:XP_006007861.2 PREDICTED: alpha-ketoglutarate-dependent dioxygenase alkB homolog 4 isoform X3 [Latimeria chalumnae]
MLNVASIWNGGCMAEGNDPLSGAGNAARGSQYPLEFEESRLGFAHRESDPPLSCGCKGIRSCLICERQKGESEREARPQDYGPKVNFKKQKLKAGGFSGLPSFSRMIVDRMRQHKFLEGFKPVEQCNLDYSPMRGSAINPHFDDSWLWGERLISLNLLSDTILSMSCDSQDLLSFSKTDNLMSWESGSGQTSIPTLAGTARSCRSSSVHGSSVFHSIPYNEIEVAVHLPRRSLVVLYGAARYQWQHAIHRYNIRSRRICCTFRELSIEFSCGGKQEALGETLLGVALCFQGSPV